MTDKEKAPRVVLGPIATELIAGAEGNKQEALEAAIAHLRDAAVAPGKGNGSSTHSGALGDAAGAQSRIAIRELLAEMRTVRTAMIDLTELTLAEMRMTRLIVGTLIDGGNDDHVALMKFAGQMIQKMYEDTDLLDQEKFEELQQSEELFHRINRLEMDRSLEPEKSGRDHEEIER